MKLKTLFKTAQEIHTSKKSGVTEIDLSFKFFGLVDRLDLFIEEGKDGVLYAADNSGEMSFKRFPGLAWFKFVAFDYKTDAAKILEAQK